MPITGAPHNVASPTFELGILKFQLAADYFKKKRCWHNTRQAITFLWLILH